MKTLLRLIFCTVAFISIMVSCDDTQTYAEQKEYEYGCINNFIQGNTKTNTRPIKVISESDFKAQGEITDTAQNEFVLFNNSGIYMQIVNKGCGTKLKNGETADVLCRYYEYNINGDSLQSFNEGAFAYATKCDKMAVINTSGTFAASFSYGMMATLYKTTTVPTGWLVPLTYINLGRPQNENEEIAHVRIIVPHDQGQTYATSGVYACYYDITYERGL